MESVESQDYSYNKNLFVRESHNCYTYFLNLKSDKAYFLCKETYKKKGFVVVHNQAMRLKCLRSKKKISIALL